jgi:hypothetical protein
LKAAVKSGQPPTAVIFSDPDHKEWTMWDFRLFKAHYILKDWYRNGIPMWWDESDRVTFDVKARTSKSRAAIERAMESDSKKKSKSHGKYYTVEPRVMDGGEMPTREEWLEEEEMKRGTIKKAQSAPQRGPHILQGKK